MKKTKEKTVTETFQQAVDGFSPEMALAAIQEAMDELDRNEVQTMFDTQMKLNVTQKWIEKNSIKLAANLAIFQPGQEIIIQVGSGEEPDVIRGTISEVKPGLIVVSSYAEPLHKAIQESLKKVLARESLIIQEEARKQEPYSSELSEEQKIQYICDCLGTAEGGEMRPSDLLDTCREVMSAGDCLRLTKELLEFGAIHAIKNTRGGILSYELA